MGFKGHLPKAALFLSALALFALGISHSFANTGVAAALSFGLYVFVSREKTDLPKGKWNISYLFFSVAALLYIGGNFYFTWIGSAAVRRFAEKLGVDAFFLVVFCFAIGIAFAFPLVYLSIQWLMEDVEDGRQKKLMEWLHSKTFFLCCMAALAFGLFLQVVFSFSRDIWVDEAFSLAMIKHSYGEMLELTMQDVHPPLYYFILKFLVDAAHKIFGEFPSVYAAKFVSVIPYVLLSAICFWKIKKGWSHFLAGMWAVCLVGTGYLLSYGVEVRMYSFGMLFVTMAYLRADSMIRQKKRADWAFFVLYSLAAAYTHYFACVAVAVFWLLLLVWHLRHDKKQLSVFTLSACCMGIGYLPWAVTLIQQVKTVSEAYWIPALTVGTLYEYANFIFGKSLFVIPVSALLLFLWKEWKKGGQNQWQAAFSLSGICAPFFVAAFGVAATLLMRPVFVSRYMAPALACFWLGCLLACEIKKRNRITVCLSYFLILTVCCNFMRFARLEYSHRAESNRLFELLETKRDALFLFHSDRIARILGEMSDNEISLWGGENKRPIGKGIWEMSEIFFCPPAFAFA